MPLAESNTVPLERRALPRQPTTLRGKVFPGGHDCTIRDYNERGARLQFGAGAPEADHFIVVVWSTGLAFEAQERWRGGEEAGVRFLKSCDFRGRTPEFFWAARAEWLKSRPKLPRRALGVRSSMIDAGSNLTTAPTPSYMLRPRTKRD